MVMGAKQHHFVLVHGGGHGAWCWVKIVSVLEKAGHRVTTVDLVSAGENSEMVPDDISSLEQYSQPLEDLFASFPAEEKVILVGHSLGGMSISRVSEVFPTKISVAVYLAAFMPGPGYNTSFTAIDRSFVPSFSDELKLNFKVEGGPCTSMEFTPKILKSYFYNKCSREDLEFAMDRVKAFPVFTMLIEPICLTAEKYGSVPKISVIALEDKVIPIACLHKMIAWNPPSEVREIEADHSLFFSAIESVEKILNDVAAKYDS